MSKPMSRVEAGRAPGLRHADHAARRPRQDRVLALEQLRRREPAGRHHEHEADPRRVGSASLPSWSADGASRRSLPRHLRHVAAQDRRQIGVDHRRVAAADELDQRRYLVADRNLRKAHLARERGDALLMRGIAIGVHEHDRDGRDAVAPARLERGAHAGEIGRALHGAVGAHALVDLDHALVQHLRLDDVPGEDLRPRLVADPSASRKPLVITSSVRSPLRSSSALVATVVPILMAPMRPGGIGSPRARPSRSRMPCTAASR